MFTKPECNRKNQIFIIEYLEGFKQSWNVIIDFLFLISKKMYKTKI
ncbi:hypothetical protein M153_6900016214 [Pseudoloma neurophilia]|uniref:Uncharacterized protein n=1 Tax=Pseudoloma neurophilia TaxID=146866 RepID=A0A0R0M9P2_9MICR|nr:hypothetical protein M153_6900016214 [Pseudoloma neurophilia]